MADDGDRKSEEELLRALAEDESVQPSVRLAALKELRALRPPTGLEAPPPTTQEEFLRGLRTFEEPPEVARDPNVPADPMRALDFAAVAGERMDPLAEAWTRVVTPTGHQAFRSGPAARARALRDQQTLLRRLRAAGITATGPDGEYVGPDGDELARRRRGGKAG